MTFFILAGGHHSPDPTRPAHPVKNEQLLAGLSDKALLQMIHPQLHTATNFLNTPRYIMHHRLIAINHEQ